MKLQLGGLSEGHHTFEETVSCSALELPEDQFPGDAQLRAVVDRHAVNLHIRLFCKADARLMCDRCLCAFSVPIDEEVRILYTENAELAADSKDEFLRQQPASGEIHLGEDVRQALLLQLPMQILCNMDCKGLCDQCGTDLNTGTCTCSTERIDPRWEKLRALRS